MNNIDSGGFWVARARADRADSAAAIDDWEALSNRLKAQLEQATKKVIFTDAQVDGEAALRRKLEDELRRIDPNHELLRKDIQRQVKAGAMSTKLEQQGYRYDTKTFTVSKIR